MDILGIRFGPEPKADEASVESMRAWLRYPRRAAVISACTAALFCVVVLFWISLGQELVSRIAASENLHWVLFATGMTLGTRAGFYLSLGMCLLLLEVRTRNSGARRARHLMLEFYGRWDDRNTGSAAVVRGAGEQAEAQGRRILGMRIFARRKTDEQYVESIRAWARHSGWWAVLQMSGSVLLVIFSLIWLMFWVQALRIGGLEGSSRGWQGFGAGVLWGVVIGPILSLALGPLERLGTIIHGCRAERLMLKYYDELHRQEDNPAAPTAGQ